MSGHDLLTLIVFGVCRDEYPDEELGNNGYSLAHGPLYKLCDQTSGAACCARTGHVDVEEVPSGYLSPEEALIMRRGEDDFFEGWDDGFETPVVATPEVTYGDEHRFDDELDPTDVFASRAGSPKRRRIRRPGLARIAVHMIGGVASRPPQRAIPPWVNARVPMRVYVTP